MKMETNIKKGINVKKGKIIVVEGSDCSFKATTSEGLYEKIKAEGYNVIKFSFPNYKSSSSQDVKDYLAGKFGDKPDDVNPRRASEFYANDRKLTYHNELKDFYIAGGIIIFDRFVSSNMIHQACKIDDIDEKIEFLDWVSDLEYGHNQLPIPDEIIFLDMPPNIAWIINEKRKNKITSGNEKDIHEKDKGFLERSHKNGLFLANRYKWKIVSCVETDILSEVINGIPQNVKSREKMLDEVYEIVKIHL